MPPTSSLMTSDLSSSDETMSSTSLAGTSSKAQTPPTSSNVNRPAKRRGASTRFGRQSSRGRSSSRLPLEASDDAGGQPDRPRSEGQNGHPGDRGSARPSESGSAPLPARSPVADRRRARNGRRPPPGSRRSPRNPPPEPPL